MKTKGNSVSLSAAVEKAVAKVVRPQPVAGPGGGDSQIVRIRDRHHQMAKLVAAGVPEDQISKVMGITQRNLDMLIRQTPAFIQLIAEYRLKAIGKEIAAELYVDVLNSNMIAAEQILRDKLMEEGDEMSPSMLNKIGMDRADRLGYGKQSLSVNVNVDLAERLDQRRRKRLKSPGVGDGGASSERADSRSAPPILDLKAEPEPPVAVSPAEPKMTPTPQPSARPLIDTPEERLARAQEHHPVAKYLHEKYGPARNRIPGFQEIPRRI